MVEGQLSTGPTQSSFQVGLLPMGLPCLCFFYTIWYQIKLSRRNERKDLFTWDSFRTYYCISKWDAQSSIAGTGPSLRSSRPWLVTSRFLHDHIAMWGRGKKSTLHQGCHSEPIQFGTDSENTIFVLFCLDNHSN